MGTELANRKTIIDQQQADIVTLQADGQALAQQLQQLEADAIDGISELEASLTQALSNLYNINAQMDDMKTQIEGQEVKIQYLQDLSTFHYQRTLVIESRLTTVEQELAQLKGLFQNSRGRHYR